MRARHASSIAFTALTALAGCAASLPEDRAVRGLYRDLEKQVALRESDDWVIDRVEVDEALPRAMLSVCRVSAATRQELLSFLDRRIAARGGPARSLWESEGDTARFREVRRWERMRALLARGDSIATDECPYWLPADPGFAGVQTDEGRLVLLGETIGGGALFLSDGESEVGGGGAARVLAAVGLLPRLTLGLGVEFGGSASLVSTPEGNRTFEGNFAAALPVLVRHSSVNRFFDVEVALTTRWRDRDARLPPGLRLGIGYGFSALRISGLMPYAAVWLGYEIVPEATGLPTLHVLWLGTRVGIDWDP